MSVKLRTIGGELLNSCFFDTLKKIVLISDNSSFDISSFVVTKNDKSVNIVEHEYIKELIEGQYYYRYTFTIDEVADLKSKYSLKNNEDVFEVSAIKLYDDNNFVKTYIDYENLHKFDFNVRAYRNIQGYMLEFYNCLAKDVYIVSKDKDGNLVDTKPFESNEEGLFTLQVSHDFFEYTHVLKYESQGNKVEYTPEIIEINKNIWIDEEVKPDYDGNIIINTNKSISDKTAGDNLEKYFVRYNDFLTFNVGYILFKSTLHEDINKIKEVAEKLEQKGKRLLLEIEIKPEDFYVLESSLPGYIYAKDSFFKPNYERVDYQKVLVKNMLFSKLQRYVDVGVSAFKINDLQKFSVKGINNFLESVTDVDFIYGTSDGEEINNVKVNKRITSRNRSEFSDKLFLLNEFDINKIKDKTFALKGNSKPKKQHLDIKNLKVDTEANDSLYNVFYPLANENLKDNITVCFASGGRMELSEDQMTDEIFEHIQRVNRAFKYFTVDFLVSDTLSEQKSKVRIIQDQDKVLEFKYGDKNKLAEARYIGNQSNEIIDVDLEGFYDKLRIYDPVIIGDVQVQGDRLVLMPKSSILLAYFKDSWEVPMPSKKATISASAVAGTLVAGIVATKMIKRYKNKK